MSERKRDSGTTVVGVAIAVAIVVVALAVGLFVALRLNGTRTLVQDWLEKKTGMALEVKSLRLGLPCDLVLEEVSTGSAPGGRASAKQVRIGFRRSRPGVSVSLSGVQAVLVRKSAGQWEPVSLTKLGNLPAQRVSAISGLTENLRKRWKFQIEDGSIRWTDERGQELAYAAGVAFAVEPIPFPKETAYWYQLSMRSRISPGGVRQENLTHEWLALSGRPYIELSSSGTRTAQPAAASSGSRPAVGTAGGVSRPVKGPAPKTQPSKKTESKKVKPETRSSKTKTETKTS